MNNKSKMRNLCNMPIVPNKKGDHCNSHRPELFRIDSYVLQAQTSIRKKHFSNLFSITKTLQVYV